MSGKINRNVDKILFISHMAIGDFVYLHNFFQAFSIKFPWMKIHLWIDETRCTADASRWESLKNYSLYDWVEGCGLFEKVYRSNYAPHLREAAVLEARALDYPLVVSFATLRPNEYAHLSRRIGGDLAYVVGVQGRQSRYLDFFRRPSHVNAYFSRPPRPRGWYHISDEYADLFSQLGQVGVPVAGRLPEIQIPSVWMRGARDAINVWRNKSGSEASEFIFINPYAKENKRCWPLSQVVSLIKGLREVAPGRNFIFLVNATPDKQEEVLAEINSADLSGVYVFSAAQNFYQLPAMLTHCKLIVSVETAVMHLANAVDVPVVALMRQKTPEWVPLNRMGSIVLATKRRSDWVSSIAAQQVLEALSIGSDIFE